MTRLGITGGIGSGKTTVCVIFERLGVPVYYADIRAKQLVDEDPDIKKARHLELRAKDLWAETSAAYRSKGGIIDENE